MDEDDWIKDYLLPKGIDKMIKNLSLSENQTPKDLSKIVIQFSTDWISTYFKKMLGIEIKFESSEIEEYKTYMAKHISKILEAFEKVSKLSEGSICEAIDILGKPITELINEFTTYQYESFFDLYDDIYKKRFSVDYEDSYLSKTKIKLYSDSIYNLIDQALLSNNGFIFVTNLFESQKFLADLIFISNISFELQEDVNYLNRTFKRFREPTIYELINIYYQLSEVYSKFAVIIRILIEFIEGKTKIDLDFEYNKHSLYNHVEKIIKNPKYVILGDVDTIIRNSKSHCSYLYDSEQKIIIFKDRKHTEKLRPKELLQKTRELSGLVFSLLRIPDYALYKRLIFIRDYCYNEKHNQDKN